MNSDNRSFQYTYSAKEQSEIEAIRRKYLSEEVKVSSLALLRRLDAGVKKKANAVALTVGIIGTLILGLGMCLVLTELGDFLGDLAMIWGILIGLTGIALAAFAYPIYGAVLKHQKKKMAPKILKLADELSGDK